MSYERVEILSHFYCLTFSQKYVILYHTHQSRENIMTYTSTLTEIKEHHCHECGKFVEWADFVDDTNIKVYERKHICQKCQDKLTTKI